MSFLANSSNLFIIRSYESIECKCHLKGIDRELKIFVGVITEEAQREKRSDSLNLGNSQSYKLSYAPPEVLKVTPENGPTVGGIKVNISGKHFGLSPERKKVRIGTRPCEEPTLYNGVDMDTIECILPSGQGGGLNVEVTIDGQTSKLSSSPVQFSYYRPSVSSISPSNGPTSGRLSFVTYSKSRHGSFFESDGTKLVGRNTSFLKDVKHKGAWIRYLYNTSGYHVTAR